MQRLLADGKPFGMVSFCTFNLSEGRLYSLLRGGSCSPVVGRRVKAELQAVYLEQKQVFKASDLLLKPQAWNNGIRPGVLFRWYWAALRGGSGARPG